MSRTLVTSALPYANGPIHIGHLAGAYLPADIYVRFLKLMHQDVVYICGTDEHGTPITLQAQKRGISPQNVVDEFHDQIFESLKAADIEFDFFGRTTDPAHYQLTQEFFLDLFHQGLIQECEEEHFYCSPTGQFLPDRYVMGECPYCGNPNARGDECNKCGKWIESDKLKNPRSDLCPVEVVKKNTKHWFLSLDKSQVALEKWIESKTDWKQNVVTFVKGWFKEGLKPRAITRDLSWGVPIPLDDPTAQGKVLYVWFDAPIGYLSMTQKWASEVKKEPDGWKKYWLASEETKLIHFVGKDNIPFHAIVWPAMLMGQEQNYVFPSHIPANEYLTIEGEKISTSIGNAIWIEDVVQSFGADYLRFYLASISPENKDADFSWNHFGKTINADLVNSIGNLYQRVTSFIADRFAGLVPAIGAFKPSDKKMLEQIQQAVDSVIHCFSTFQVKEAYKAILELSHLGNAYFQESEPWKLITTDSVRVGTICNVLMRLIEAISVLLLPIIPMSSYKMLKHIQSPFINHAHPLQEYFKLDLDPTGHRIVKQLPLFKRIEDAEIVNQQDILKKRMEDIVDKSQKEEGVVPPQLEVELKNNISIEQFSALSIQTGKILLVEPVPKSDKLLRFILDTAEGERQILSGIASAYPQPEVLLGKYVAFIANLPPRKMMGLESNGMILSAKNSSGVLEVVEVSEQVGKGATIQ